MDTALYLLARALIALLQSLSLPTVARIGRVAGGLAYALDARHRRVAIRNLQMCLGAEKSWDEIRALARENFKRLGENYCSAIKTAVMSEEDLHPHFIFNDAEKIATSVCRLPSRNGVFAIGHFGNFELYARCIHSMPEFKFATTYRGLRQPSLNRLMQSLRERSGCLFFERRSEAAALKARMSAGNTLLGLLADQHAGVSGVRIPFLGHDCATSAAPAVLALRYHCPLHTAICYRVGLAKWHVEICDEIPTQLNGHPRDTKEIMLDVNRAFEIAVRRDPANWFWVHNRWKPDKSRVQSPASKAAAAEATS